MELRYVAAKKVLFQSKVVGTDDTSMKVLDPSLNFARTGRIWPYLGDVHHPVMLYGYARPGWTSEISGRVHRISAVAH
jgi:hypothetical protein